MSELDLIAFTIGLTEGWHLVTADRNRDWMDQTPKKFAYRCLPMTMANSGGWWVLCPTDIFVTWNGQESKDSLTILIDDSRYSIDEVTHIGPICSHFGSGIISFSFPWLFRTNIHGIGLRAEGPTNLWLPGLFPLTGLIETWGHVSSFTMNWKVTDPNRTIHIPKHFPICFLSLYNFFLTDDTTPYVVSRNLLKPEIKIEYDKWNTKRRSLLDGDGGRHDMSYTRHEYVNGGKIDSPHWTGFKMNEFALAEEDTSIDSNDSNNPQFTLLLGP